MISLEQLQAHFNEAGVNICEYRCRVNLNIYDSPHCKDLATQAATRRHLHIQSVKPTEGALPVRLCEDGYSGWLSVQDLSGLEEAKTIYQPVFLGHEQIRERLPAVIAFSKQAMQQANYYLWGGTVAPNYDCSGLTQAAFAASEIWLPRDSYQQADFTQRIRVEQLLAGDLVFFAKAEKVNHVGLYLGNGFYIHSSGRETGRNGIAIDQLSAEGDEIAQSYYRQFRMAGRVVESYQSQKHC